MWNMRSKPRVAWAIGAFAIVWSASVRAEAEWTHVLTRNGVTVTAKAVAGRDLPVFRGTGIVDASPYEVLAVLADTSRRPEWLESCAESRLIETHGPYHRTTYSLTDVPWPGSDRDVVLDVEVEVDGANSVIMARFHSVEDARVPPVDGVVRIPFLRGHYEARLIAPGKTRVVYQVDADPGGWMPDFIVRWAARKLPFDTIRKLRRQVARTRGHYEPFLDRFDPSRRLAVHR